MPTNKKGANNKNKKRKSKQKTKKQTKKRSGPVYIQFQKKIRQEPYNCATADPHEPRMRPGLVEEIMDFLEKAAKKLKEKRQKMSKNNGQAKIRGMGSRNRANKRKNMERKKQMKSIRNEINRQ